MCHIPSGYLVRVAEWSLRSSEVANAEPEELVWIAWIANFGSQSLESKHDDLNGQHQNGGSTQARRA